MDTALGTIVTADEVCQAVQATLEAWMATALTVVGLDVDAPHTYEQVPTLDALQKADLPAVGIASPGFASEPVRDSDGSYQITWRVNVIAFLRGDDYADTQRKTRVYAAILSTILSQQQTLLGFADGTRLVDESYEPISDGARTLGGAVIGLDVTVSDARNDLAAPLGPPPAQDELITSAVSNIGIDIAREA